MFKPSKNPLNQAPPLRVWIALLCILLVLGLVSWPVYSKWITVTSDFIPENNSRLKAFGKYGAKDDKRIVAMGDSLLYSATLFDRDMESFARTRNIKGFSFLRIARPGGDFSHFLPLFEELWNLPPDILIIQQGALFYIESNSGECEGIGYGHYLMELLRGKKAHRDVWNMLEDNDEKLLKFTGGKRSLKDAIAAVRRIKNEPPVDKDLINNFLAKAKQKGVQVVILDVPRFSAVDEVLAEDDKADRLELRRLLKEEHRLPWLQFPTKLSADHFIDYSHMNASGREEYSYWLSVEIENLLNR